MNARALTGFAVVLLAMMMAAAPVAFGQTIGITAPMDDQRFPIGHDPADENIPLLTGDVTIEFTAVLPDGVTGAVNVYVDDEPMYTEAADGSIALTDLDVGAHTVMLWLVDDGGVEYPFVPDSVDQNDPFRDTTPPAAAVRFFISRLCRDASDCVDADPCSLQECIGEVDAGSWFGHCRFGDDLTAGDECCVAESSCLRNGLFQADGSGLLCADTDGDTIGECVVCVLDGDCPTAHSACIIGATCENIDEDPDLECNYVYDGCCNDGDCDDGDNCTIDYCCDGVDSPLVGCLGATECFHVVVDECCNTDADCDDSDYCTVDRCLGSGPDAYCAHGRPVANCCDADEDCNSAAELNVCNNPDDRGYATCAGLNPPTEMAGVCDYGFTPGCCVYDYHCGDRFPQEVGTCVDNLCVYEENTEYCESPIDTVVINEFQVNPMGSEDVPVPDIKGEWMELFNPTDTDININGWTFRDLQGGDAGQMFTIDDPYGMLVVPAGGYVLIVRDENSNGGLQTLWDYVHPESDFMLDNTADEIQLINDLGEIQDEVAYDETWDVQEGVAFALIHPYLDNIAPGSWAHAKAPYQFNTVWQPDGSPGNYGTPKFVNDDVLNTAAVPSGGTCDDSNPCTIDICNHDKASLCSHIEIQGCCTTLDDIACNDHNVCTTDSCDLATNECLHDQIADCCVVNADCIDWYPSWVLPGEEGDFDICATKACIGSTCRYGRRGVERPGCCLSGDHEYFGCEDRNLCTVDACTQDAGLDLVTGEPYPACVFDLDLDGDNINDCCRADDECEDNDPITLDYCNLNVVEGDVNTCQYPPDLDYCGAGGNESCDDGDVCTDDYCCDDVDSPQTGCEGADRCLHVAVPECCTVDTDCIDGQACTQDICCAGVGDPDPACTRANTCAHPEVASGCCTTHDDCRTEETNPYYPCRTGFCIGAVCRFGPHIDGCCVDVDDCDPGVCSDAVCDGDNNCVYTPREGCCTTGADCDQAAAPGPCEAAVCIDNACEVVAIPNCCEDDNPAGPDLSCDDDNPCTQDFCTTVGDNNQCRYYPTGGLGCCNSDDMCPDDNVKCTLETCNMDENSCRIDPVVDCRSTLVYAMSFTEGHAAYAGQYEALSDLAWTVVDIGTGAGLPYLGFGSAGELGPDTYLSFLPTATASDVETCAALPMLRTRLMDYVTIGFDFGADWEQGTAHLVLRGCLDGDWANAAAVPGGSFSFSQDIPGGHYNVSLTDQLINSDDTQLAFCFSASSTDNVAEIMVDEIVVSQGRAPVWLDVDGANNLSPLAVDEGANASFTAAFQVREFDTDEAVSFRILSSPGAWLRITNVQRVAGDPTRVQADFEVVDAVCPASGDSYDLVIEAKDGALYDYGFLNLTINNCL